MKVVMGPSQPEVGGGGVWYGRASLSWDEGVEEVWRRRCGGGGVRPNAPNEPNRKTGTTPSPTPTTNLKPGPMKVVMPVNLRLVVGAFGTGGRP